VEKAKINARQLFFLILLFELGTAIVIPLGIEAKQDAWLAILTGMAGGLLLFLVYHRLYQFYPDIPLTSYVQKIIGRFVGKLIALIYIIYFLYIAARDLRDFGELLLTFAYPETPLFLLNTIMIFTVGYAVYKGIEVLARTGELFFVLIYLLAVSGFVLIVVTGLIDLNKLKPVLEEGFQRVIKETLTQTLYVPFGEVVVFTMLLPYLNKPAKAKFVGVSAMALSGFNLALTMAVNIAVLGADVCSRSPFPLLTTIQRIEVADFLERLDVYFMIALVIGSFFKVAVFFYAAVVGIADLFRVQEHTKLVYPLVLVTLLLSMAIASNFSEHIKEGLEIVPIYLHVPLQVIVPIFLLIIAFIKNKLIRTS
jgi:spore germination protein KB